MTEETANKLWKVLEVCYSECWIQKIRVWVDSRERELTFTMRTDTHRGGFGMTYVELIENPYAYDALLRYFSNLIVALASRVCP